MGDDDHGFQVSQVSPPPPLADWNLFTTLGRIVAEATGVEHALMELLMHLLGDDEKGWRVGRGERYSALLGMIGRVVETSTDPWLDDLRRFTKEAERVMKQRDDVVHSAWLWLPNDDERLTPRATKHARGKSHDRTWTAEELGRLQIDLANVRFDLRFLGWDIMAMRTNAPFDLTGQRVGDIMTGRPFGIKPWPWAGEHRQRPPRPFPTLKRTPRVE